MLRKSWGPLGAWAIVFAMAVLAAPGASGQSAERKLLKKVAPEYPAILREKHIRGTVKLNVIVKADGSVKDVIVVGGNPALVDASVRAVKQWKYAPADHETTIEVAIQFDPNS